MQLGPMIAAIAPACEVAITVTQNNETQGNTAAADWLEVSSSKLLNRIKGNVDVDESLPTTHPWERLTELRDEDGKLYGRARIDAGDYWSPSGVITVDGLAASRIGLVAGILIGALCRSDNGPEFIARAVRRWIVAVGARNAFIEPGSPWENGYCESFESQLRDDLLKGQLFYSLTRQKSSTKAGGSTAASSIPLAPGYKPPAPRVLVLHATLPEPASPAARALAVRPTTHGI